MTEHEFLMLGFDKALTLAYAAPRQESEAIGGRAGTLCYLDDGTILLVETDNDCAVWSVRLVGSTATLWPEELE
jgi:hypothetical protein